MSFEGRVALITGGTSGIGAACALEFASCGAKIVIVGRNRAKGDKVVSGLREAGGEAIMVTGDVADPKFCVYAVDESVKHYGRLDVVVNSAGINPRGDALTLTDKQWMDALSVNVSGTFWMCRAAIRVMRQQNAGAIVNVASDWGLVAGRGHVAYCASKGAVVNMTRALALDHIGDGIRINAICPGEVRTPMLQSGLDHRGYDAVSGMEDLGKSLPIGRVSEPREQARCIRFLASDDASFIVGATLSVDGGSTAL